LVWLSIHASFVTLYWLFGGSYASDLMARAVPRLRLHAGKATATQATGSRAPGVTPTLTDRATCRRLGVRTAHRGWQPEGHLLLVGDTVHRHCGHCHWQTSLRKPPARPARGRPGTPIPRPRRFPAESGVGKSPGFEPPGKIGGFPDSRFRSASRTLPVAARSPSRDSRRGHRRC
jgi:hypothetical protein